MKSSNLLYFKPGPRFPKKPKEKSPQEAQLDRLVALSPAELASGINQLLTALERKDISLKNWDDPTKILARVTVKKGEFCYLEVSNGTEKKI